MTESPIESEAAANGPQDAGHRTHGEKAACDHPQREGAQSAAVQLLIFFRATRPLSSVVAGAMSASILIAGQDRISRMSLAAGLAMTVLAMFGFVINDLFDYEKDAAGHVTRPIATGELSKTKALIFAFGLLVVLFPLTRIAGSGGEILAITSLALVAYSPIAQRYPLAKGAYVAGLCCSPLFYGSLVGGIQCPWFSYATLACFVFGREALMDAEELVGDRLAGVDTIAAVLGYRRTRRIGATIMLLSTFGLVAAARNSTGRVVAAIMLLSLMGVFAWPHLSDATRIKLSRFPMLVGVVAIAIGGKSP